MRGDSMHEGDAKMTSRLFLHLAARGDLQHFPWRRARPVPAEEVATVFLVAPSTAARSALGESLRAAGYVLLVFDTPDAFFAAGSLPASGCLIWHTDVHWDGRLPMPAELAVRGVRVPVVYLSAGLDVRSVVAAVKAGAADFLLEPVEPAQMVPAIASAIEENRRQKQYWQAVSDARSCLRRLSARECEVLALVVQGATSTDVAERLSIGVRTVEAHRRRIRRKTGVQSVAGWVRLVLLAQGELTRAELSPGISCKPRGRRSP